MLIKETIHVCLIEDDPGDYEIIRELLSEARHRKYELTWEPSFQGGVALMQKNEHDVYLVDYRLGAHNGLMLIHEARLNSCDGPIILLTGQGYEDLDIEALETGASDFLEKGRFDTVLLEKTIRYAIERRLSQQVLLEIKQTTRKISQIEAELSAMDKIPYQIKMTVSEEIMGMQSLSKAQPELFKEFVELYKTFIEKALEAQAYRVETPLAGSLHSLSNRLGFVSATPRDLVDIHTIATKALLTNSPSKKALIILDEGKLILLQLLGYLCSYYRSHVTRHTQSFHSTNTPDDKTSDVPVKNGTSPVLEKANDKQRSERS